MLDAKNQWFFGCAPFKPQRHFVQTLHESPNLATFFSGPSQRPILNLPSSKVEGLLASRCDPFLLLMAEIRLTSWGNGSLSHYLQGFYTSQVVQDFSHQQSQLLISWSLRVIRDWGSDSSASSSSSGAAGRAAGKAGKAGAGAGEGLSKWYWWFRNPKANHRLDCAETL